jgi:hypothetical protein
MLAIESQGPFGLGVATGSEVPEVTVLVLLVCLEVSLRISLTLFGRCLVTSFPIDFCARYVPKL